MNFKELKERIKLNAEYIKYSRLVNHKSVEPRHKMRHKELKDKLSSTNEYKCGITAFNDLYIRPDKIRLYHIAYSLLKGNKYSQIEVKVKEENILKPSDWAFIDNLVKVVNEENVRDSQK